MLSRVEPADDDVHVDYDMKNALNVSIHRRETVSTHWSCFEESIIFAPVQNHGAVPELCLLVQVGRTCVRSSQNGERYLRCDLASQHASGVHQSVMNLCTFRLVPVDVGVVRASPNRSSTVITMSDKTLNYLARIEAR